MQSLEPLEIGQRSLLRYKRPRLAAVLFQQLHIGDGHAPVDGFAHVVNGQQGELDGGQKSGDSPRTDPKDHHHDFGLISLF